VQPFLPKLRWEERRPSMRVKSKEAQDKTKADLEKANAPDEEEQKTAASPSPVAPSSSPSAESPVAPAPKRAVRMIVDHGAKTDVVSPGKTPSPVAEETKESAE
jgi:hypothetical protein